MTIDEKLEAIRKRAEAATPGPWEARFATGEPEQVMTNEPPYYLPRNFYDCEFIANARQDIPALLRLVDELRGQRNDWIKVSYSMWTRVAEEIKQKDQAALDAMDVKPLENEGGRE